MHTCWQGQGIQLHPPHVALSSGSMTLWDLGSKQIWGSWACSGPEDRSNLTRPLTLALSRLVLPRSHLELWPGPAEHRPRGAETLEGRTRRGGPWTGRPTRHHGGLGEGAGELDVRGPQQLRPAVPLGGSGRDPEQWRHRDPASSKAR